MGEQNKEEFSRREAMLGGKAGKEKNDGSDDIGRTTTRGKVPRQDVS